MLCITLLSLTPRSMFHSSHTKRGRKTRNDHQSCSTIRQSQPHEATSLKLPGYSGITHLHKTSWQDMGTLTLLLVAALFRESASLQVTISPQHAHLESPAESLHVRCLADVAITHCQLRVVGKTPVDLSRGSYSTVEGYQYEGEGLETGHCGATISPDALVDWKKTGLVQCRVRNDRSDWAYATMGVYRYSYTRISITTKSRLLVVPPGGDVSHLLQAEEVLTRCDLKHPLLGWKDLRQLPSCRSGADSVCYHGQGLGHKQCGAIISNVTDASNGVLWFSLETIPGLEQDHVTVIVSKPPSTPVLTAATTHNVDGTSTLQASCTLSGSRPAARTTWVMDGVEVTDGNVVSVPEDRWVLQYEEQTTTQQLTLTLDATAGGKELWCVANHVALPTPLSSNKVKLVVPKPPSSADPCNPSPCGAGMRCWASGRDALCEQVLGCFNRPSESDPRLECAGQDCPPNKECVFTSCMDPCPSACRSEGDGNKTTDSSMEGSFPVLAATESQEMTESMESNGTRAATLNPGSTTCSTAALAEHRVRMLHMAELHRLQLQSAQARARVEEQNAKAARARARVEEEKIMTARAWSTNAEEDLEFQRELRRVRLQQMSGLAGTE